MLWGSSRDALGRGWDGDMSGLSSPRSSRSGTGIGVPIRAGDALTVQGLAVQGEVQPHLGTHYLGIRLDGMSNRADFPRGRGGIPQSSGNELRTARGKVKRRVSLTPVRCMVEVGRAGQRSPHQRAIVKRTRR